MTDINARASVHPKKVFPKKDFGTKKTRIEDETVRRRIGLVLRVLRTFNDLTITQAGENAGVNSKYISRIELGDYCPSLQFLEKYATGLNISVDSIFRFCMDTTANEFTYQNMMVKIGQELLSTRNPIAKGSIRLP